MNPDDYAPPSDRPPPPHAVFAALFNTLFATGLVLARRQGRQLPERVEPRDLIVIGVATHKLSRLISKDKVTAPLRAPFTELEEKGGPSEFEESSRGKGLRKAV